MKRRISMCLAILMVFTLVTVPVYGQETITVLLNGEQLEFDVAPILLNDRTMVPMRAVFEALNAKVAWNDQNETVTGISSQGKRVVIGIGDHIAMVDGIPIEIDQPPVLLNDRTLVPLRFISESFDCKVGWDETTSTVTISSEESAENNIVYLGVSSYATLGCWTLDGATILRGKVKTDDGKGTPTDVTTDDAIANVNIMQTGKYKIWVNSRDYATNQPGSRYFNVAVDGVRNEKRFGTHGKEGFLWEELGVYDLTEGTHQIALQDTSGFYARCQGIIISGDMDYIPSNDYAEYSQYLRDSLFDGVIPANYPVWAKKELTDETTETLENDKVKIVFYQGQGERGNQVQNEIYIQKNGAWILAKEKSEDLGVLAMRADETAVSYVSPAHGKYEMPTEEPDQKYEGAYGTIDAKDIKSFYKTGNPEWLIPSTMTKLDENTIVLVCSSDNVDATLTFKLDDLTYEPKVTMDATMKTAGAYSFVFFTGDDFKDGSFSRVTAPLGYVNQYVPENDYVVPEYSLFTPMCTFTFGEGENTITKGIVVDPLYVQQRVAAPGFSDFGLMFRSPQGYVRGQFVAPLFGTENAVFDKGEQYSFSYRLVYNDLDWFENYKHITEDMYNFSDLRTNYYASINEAIYNTTDLMMDDIYGGWDDKDMAFYNMEGKMVTTQSNVVEIMQRYMLTDNKEILEERAVSSLAFMLSRGGMHFKRVEGDTSYTPDPPTALSGVNKSFAPSSYIALYEMSQGRTPFLLNYAVGRLEETNLNGVISNQAMADLGENEAYIKRIIDSADNYMETILSDESAAKNSYMSNFVYTNTVPMLSTFVVAYEQTGEQKYLDAAKAVGEYIATEIWTTGYQNDYATTDYTVDPVKTAERYLASDTSNWYYHKDGVQWKVGNPFGVMTKTSEAQNKLKAESAPGWLVGRAGMGTEHLLTTANSKVITMNMWAGTMLRLAKYTGEDYFETMARNAIVGRFANYSGYYWERNLLHDKQADFPYVGPDYNLIYWHHIPVFLGMLEDFLINTVWSKSEMNIEFPSVVNAGYAYFVSNQYGFAPGKFYDENDMWLWLDRGIIEPDTKEVDYIAARKDGVLGLALVNEGNNEITTTVALGEKIPNAASYTETASLYDKDGNKSTVEITNGKFTVTIPAKGIQSVVLHPQVSVPSFAKNYTVSTSVGNTVAEHEKGKAYLLQFNDDEYYAYVYTTAKPDEITSATISYTIDGKNYIETVNEYPFEKIIKVDAEQDFVYTMSVKNVDGKTEELGGGTLSPLKESEIKPYIYGQTEQADISSSVPDFDMFKIGVRSLGVGNGKLRFVVPTEAFPFEVVSENSLRGLKIKGLLTDVGTGEQKILESIIEGNEVRDNGTTVLIVTRTEAVPAEKSFATSYNLPELMVMPANASYSEYPLVAETATASPNMTLPEFEPIKIEKIVTQGTGAGKLRFVISKNDIPFECTENMLKGVKVNIVLTEIGTGIVTEDVAEATGNEMRADGNITLVVAPTEKIPVKDYNTNKVKTHSIKLTIIHP